MSITGIPELKEGYRQLGPKRFWALMSGTLAVILGYASAHMWLSGKIGWPEEYGFYCSRKCMFEDMWHSPALLEQGSPYELGMFALIWLLPVFVVCCLIYALMKRRGRNPILPMNSVE